MPPKEIRWFFAGFAIATALAALLDPRPADAQTAAARGRPAGLTYPNDASGAPRPAAPAEAGPLEPEPEPASNGAADDPLEDDPDDRGRARTGQRAVVIDGDPNYPGEPTQPIDGIADTREPEPPLDGADATAIDMREDADRDLFENPAAGFDPLLFQIEDLAPILDRRPARLFRLEPYDPVGIKVGSFVYFPEAEIGGVGYSNVFSSPKPEKDVAAEIRTRSRLVSNWSIHAVELITTSANSFYADFESENDKAYAVEGRGRLDITRRTNIQAAFVHQHGQEDRGAIDAATVGDRPNVDTNTGNVALNHRFNRLKVQLRASLIDTNIGNADDGFGNIIVNDERDEREHEEYVRLTYQLKPSFAVFTEGGLNQRRYATASLSDGLLRDGDGERYRIGLDFGDSGKVLRGEISVGYGAQDHKMAPLERVDAFLFDSNLTWRVTELTALKLTARADIEDTTTTGASGVVTQTVGLEARHAFRRYFIGTAGIAYSNNDYAGVDTLENELRYTLDAEYYASPEVILFGKYQHTSFQSNQPLSDWDGDEMRIGVRIRR